MAELKPDSAFDNVMRVAINLGGIVLFAGVIALVVATIIEEAG